MNETFVVDDLLFELRRSNRRKTIGITVDRGGKLILSAPEVCPAETIRRIVEQKRSWIYTKQAQKEMLLRPGRKREFVNGESFLYLGRSYRLKLVPIKEDVPSLRLYHGWFLLDQNEWERGRSLFIQWYIRHGQRWIKDRVDFLKNRIGAEPSAVNVSVLGNRWGSCGRNSNLNFHWRTVLLPPRIVEYIIAHELVHLVEPHHIPDFWSRLERVIPDYLARKQWLAENGASADV